METTMLLLGIYWGYIGILENKNGNYYVIIGNILGFYWENTKRKWKLLLYII